MEKVKALGKRIENLKQRKLKLEHMKAKVLEKELKNLMGKVYSPDLALTIFNETWQNASDQQKETWYHQANFFRTAQTSPDQLQTKRYPLPDPTTYSKENDPYE